MAVIVDHCMGILYASPFIAQASFFSVSLFILLSGISIRISQEKKRKTFTEQLKKTGRLFLQYALATLVVLIYFTHFFDLKTYLTQLLNFSAQVTFYFMVFFFQLLLISPFLLSWCRFCNRSKYRYLWNTGTVFVLCILSALFIRYTYILPVHGGGQFLFGGTYIILYYLGILFAECNLFRIKTWKKEMLIFLFSSCLWVVWWLLKCYGKLPFDFYLEKYFGAGFNPPSANLIIFSIITLFMLYSFWSLLERISGKAVRTVVNIFSFIGKYTLYIYMYHLIIQNAVLTYLPFLDDNIWVKRVFVFFPMVLLPPLAAKGIKYCFYLIKNKVNADNVEKGISLTGGNKV